MSKLQPGDATPSQSQSLPPLDPTHPAWFTNQAALALLTRFTTVHGYSQMLRRVVEHAPEDAVRLDRYAHAIEREVADLGRLMQQYLEAMHLHAGLVTLMPQPVGLRDLLDAIAESSSRLPEWTERHRLEIEQPEALIGQWDPHWVIPALSAVVSNAMKFTPDGGTIQIQVRRQDGPAVVTVQDPGLGILEDERERVLLPFVRGAAAKARSLAGAWDSTSPIRRYGRMVGALTCVAHLTRGRR